MLRPALHAAGLGLGASAVAGVAWQSFLYITSSPNPLMLQHHTKRNVKLAGAGAGLLALSRVL